MTPTTPITSTPVVTPPATPVTSVSTPSGSIAPPTAIVQDVTSTPTKVTPVATPTTALALTGSTTENHVVWGLLLFLSGGFLCWLGSRGRKAPQK
ncbi:MAG: hypothetical protein WDN27_04180 [Candidatus Saccharibacteria bacterium]